MGIMVYSLLWVVQDFVHQPYGWVRVLGLNCDEPGDFWVAFSQEQSELLRNSISCAENIMAFHVSIRSTSKKSPYWEGERSSANMPSATVAQRPALPAGGLSASAGARRFLSDRRFHTCHGQDPQRLV